MRSVVYLPASETPQVAYLQASEPPQFKSLTAPILNFQDAHVSAPFFGPNVWSAKFEPVPGGGIPAHHALVELKMVFKEGGAYDFHSKFERMKERLQQAVDVARESGHMTGDGTDRGGGRGAGPMAGINMAAVDLEQLPAYEMGDPNTLYVPQNGLSQAAPGLEVSNGGQPSQPPSTGSPNETFNAPSEPPPGYEEVQRDSVAEELERRQREEQ
ncbi:MAG: hypothetical protein M1819_005560 [Sarea resinae]|nr:MAG: hypothetical protein M1819_005560 [Sarea resinae]